MLNQVTQSAQMWMTVQEPRVFSDIPNSFLLLLAALDIGWRIEYMELHPSWDQHGLIYLVMLQSDIEDQHQQIIIPKNSLVDRLLLEYSLDVPEVSRTTHVFPA
jgi:hypothetical protein